MNAVTKIFRREYFAGESAEIEVAAPGAANVSVVFGDSSLILTADGETWRGCIPTDKLMGVVSWTIFVQDTNSRSTALAHGTFTVRCAGRSKLRDVVAAIDEAIRTWGTNPNRSISVGEVRVDYKSLDDLLAVRAQYVQRAEAEESGRSLTGGLRVVEVNFR